MRSRYEVNEISYDDTKEFILKKHYAQRMPNIKWGFGLFDRESSHLLGVLTIGKPASHALCVGVLGKEFAPQVYELNRLITVDGLERNVLSWFVAQVLRRLKSEDLIIVSYADEGMNHYGYIYQATNFFYTGRTAKRTDKYTEGNKHSRHYTDENKHLRKVRTPKHRYVYFTNRKKLNFYLKLLNYPIKPYPKGEPKHYRLGERMKTKVIDTEKDVVFYV